MGEGASKAKPRKCGRPRKPEEIRELIIRMAKETGWGYRRILGELKKLRIRNISRSTVARILQEHGFRVQDVECHTRLGGLLKHYERRAA